MFVRLTLLVLTRFTRAEGTQLSFRADRSNYNASYRLENTYLRNIKHIMLLGAPYTCSIVVVAKRTATLESKQWGGVFLCYVSTASPPRKLSFFAFLRVLVGYMHIPPEA
jgi:hypothetical protein